MRFVRIIGVPKRKRCVVDDRARKLSDEDIKTSKQAKSDEYVAPAAAVIGSVASLTDGAETSGSDQGGFASI